MAGGLFGRPFTINMKCVVFSILCMALFLYKPNFTSDVFKYLTLFIIFVVAYVAMAWYDFYFDCSLVPLERGKYSFTGLFKPPEDEKPNDEIEKDETPIDETRVKEKERKKTSGIRHAYVIYFSHILFIVPLIAYVGIKKSKVNKMVYPILVVLAVFTLFYHAGHLMELVHKTS